MKINKELKVLAGELAVANAPAYIAAKLKHNALVTRLASRSTKALLQIVEDVTSTNYDDLLSRTKLYATLSALCLKGDLGSTRAALKLCSNDRWANDLVSLCENNKTQTPTTPVFINPRTRLREVTGGTMDAVVQAGGIKL